MGRYTSIVFFVVITLIATDAFARAGRENQIPNNIWGCEVCHTQAGGLNDFGFDSFDYTNGGTVNWNGLSQEDSDRDGYSNALELEGPSVTHPGDRSDGLCGNGSMEGAEECESGDLGGATCQSMGLVGGNLTCSSMCRYDTSGCDSCGDNMIAGSEECDGSDLGGNTCESLGRGTGTLSCNGCAYDYTGCTDNSDPTPLTCGNGIRQPEEDCDGSDLGGQTCATLGFTGGVLGCAVRCDFDTSGCLGGSGAPSAPSAPGQPNPGGVPGANPGTDTGAGLEAGDENKIVLEGHACSTTSSSSASSSFWLLLTALAVWRRRR